MRTKRLLGALALVASLAAVSTTVATDADAFCGFYVGGAGAKLFNDATVVVLMREGTRTVLSMANTYKGPPEKFAMVVPVPVVLQEENVKTLKRELFDHVDQLSSPRLVEYWEQDPCAQEIGSDRAFGASKAASMAAPPPAAAPAASYGVTIEAQFTVGEYQIVILSAQDSGGLEAWLHAEHYTIPEGAEPYFRPYVASGSKFFVAKVDPEKVKMVDGLAELSPLRFHYDSDEFRLPVRLGLINSSGTQDLIVNILGRGTRYEVANYPNVTIPTNLDVSEAASDQFGSFYAMLFDRTVEKNPKAVVTEYAWEPTSCDPCPGPALDMGDLATLGGDVLPSSTPQVDPYGNLSPPGVPTAPPPVLTAPPPTVTPKPAVNPKPSSSATESCNPPYWFDAQGVRRYKPQCLNGTPPPVKPAPTTVDCSTPYYYDAQGRKHYKPECLGGPPPRDYIPPQGQTAQPPPAPRPPPRPTFNPWQGGAMVLTRLHVRYTKESLGEDLIFKAAPAIVGGREVMAPGGGLEHGAQPSSYNNFQARYAVRHAWTGPIDCKEPRRGVWGGKPGTYGQTPLKPATKLGLVTRTKANLGAYVKQDIPEIDFKSGEKGSAATGDGSSPKSKGCMGCSLSASNEGLSGLTLAAAAILVLGGRRRRNR